MCAACVVLKDFYITGLSNDSVFIDSSILIQPLLSSPRDFARRTAALARSKKILRGFIKKEEVNPGPLQRGPGRKFSVPF